MILRLPVTVLGYYLLRGNWMNGFPGFVWSLLAANYRTVKYLKLYELNLDGGRFLLARARIQRM